MRYTRRTLVGGAAGAAAAAALPRSARAETSETPSSSSMASSTVPKTAEVVVVGAGLAGLSAARAVARAGRSVIVLEARERWVLPFPARWHDVDMPLQKQRRAFSPSDQPRDQVGALGLLGENANLYA